MSSRHLLDIPISFISFPTFCKFSLDSVLACVTYYLDLHVDKQIHSCDLVNSEISVTVRNVYYFPSVQTIESVSCFIRSSIYSLLEYNK